MRHFKFVNPNPFHYAEQIDWCALLGITVFRTTATRFYAYLICLTHVPTDSFSITVFHRLNQITVDIF